MPYFTWVVLAGLLTVTAVQLADFSTHTGVAHKFTPVSLIPIFSFNNFILIPYMIFQLAESVYLPLMFSWLILRIISRGCFLNPNAAISSVWDVIDWILVLVSNLVLVGQIILCVDLRVCMPVCVCVCVWSQKKYII